LTGGSFVEAKTRGALSQFRKGRHLPFGHESFG
jgi:hypothetical protein